MTPIETLNAYYDGVKTGKITSMEGLLSLFTLAGEPLTLLQREPTVPVFALNRPKRMTLLAGRQVSKSYTVAEISTLLTGFSQGFSSAIIEPRFIQKKRFNSQILAPLLRECSVRDLIIDKKNTDNLDIKTFKSGGQIILLNGYISSNGVRGTSGISLVTTDELQDIPNSFLPVFESITDAMVDTGFRIRAGTAKTSDCALAMSFEESSQGHWCIKCPCGKYNIAAPDQQLFQMIGKQGCSCAYCGRVLDVTTGYYVFKYPSRVYTHLGFHMPQIIFAFHNTKGGWGEILYKKNNWGKTEFLNEVLGVPDDDSVRLLTKGDLLKARNNIKDKASGVRLIRNYDTKVLGVDWGGGGGGDSATGLAVIAKNNNAKYYECLWMYRLPQGLSPEQEADVVANIANEFQVDFIAHDYTGAGFVRESLFLSKHPGWQPYMYPVSYTYKPTSDLVTVSTSGSRTSYTVDKTKSLLLTINCIKYGALFLPWFDEKDPNAVQLDFLAIIEHHQSLKEDVGGRNTVLRSSDVYLLDKVAGKKDDAAQAVNIGLIAACNIIGFYPIFTFDSKFDMTPEKYEMLTGEKS